MNARQIMAGAALALSVLAPVRMADAMPNGLGACLEAGTLTYYHAECPAIVHDVAPRIGVFTGYGDPGDDIAADIAACDGELIWYDQDDSFWCEPLMDIGTAMVVERTIVTAELGAATPIVANPKFMG